MPTAVVENRIESFIWKGKGKLQNTYDKKTNVYNIDLSHTSKPLLQNQNHLIYMYDIHKQELQK